jgi:hypothetical protein
MKNLQIGGAFILAMSVFVACKKSNNSNPNPSNTTSGSLVRIFQGTDPDITNDTVFLITYNQAGKIALIVDSIYSDTLAGSYDDHGNLISVTGSGSNLANESVTYTYDANNNLTQIDAMVNGETQQTIFAYTNGLVSKRSYFTNSGSGPLQLYRYFTYTVTNGNISAINIYQPNGTLLGTTNVTYGSQTNPYSNLCLFNFDGYMGIDAIAPVESYFNKNILSGDNTNSSPTTIENTFNSKQEPTKVISNDGNSLFTWQFYYK